MFQLVPKKGVSSKKKKQEERKRKRNIPKPKRCQKRLLGGDMVSMAAFLCNYLVASVTLCAIWASQLHFSCEIAYS